MMIMECDGWGCRFKGIYEGGGGGGGGGGAQFWSTHSQSIPKELIVDSKRDRRYDSPMLI